MSVDDVYKLILYIVSKNKQQGYVSPDDFNLTIAQAENSYCAYLIGNMQQYTPGRPIPRIGLGQNSVVRQRLAPSIYNYNLSVDGTGFSPYPGDYIQADAMFNIYGSKRIRSVQQDSLYSYLNSVIDPVDNNPIYLIEDKGFRFYPVGIGAAKLSYIRKAPPMKWGFTLDGNGRPVYSVNNSVQPIWDEISIFEIITRCLKMVGVNLQAGQVSQFAQEVQQNGQ